MVDFSSSSRPQPFKPTLDQIQRNSSLRDARGPSAIPNPIASALNSLSSGTANNFNPKLPYGVGAARIDEYGRVVVTIQLNPQQTRGNLFISYKGQNFSSEPSATDLGPTIKIDNNERYTIRKITNADQTHLEVTIAEPVESLTLMLPGGPPFTLNQANIRSYVQNEAVRINQAVAPTASPALTPASRVPAAAATELQRVAELSHIRGRLEGMLGLPFYTGNSSQPGQMANPAENVLRVDCQSAEAASKAAGIISALGGSDTRMSAIITTDTQQLVFDLDKIAAFGASQFFSLLGPYVAEIKEMLASAPTAAAAAAQPSITSPTPTPTPTPRPPNTSVAPSIPEKDPRAAPLSSSTPPNLPLVPSLRELPTLPANGANFRQLKEELPTLRPDLPVRTGVVQLTNSSNLGTTPTTGLSDPVGMRVWTIDRTKIAGYAFLRELNGNPVLLYVTSENGEVSELEGAALQTYSSLSNVDNSVIFNTLVRLNASIQVNGIIYRHGLVRPDGSFVLSGGSIAPTTPDEQASNTPAPDLVIEPKLAEDGTVTWSTLGDTSRATGPTQPVPQSQAPATQPAPATPAPSPARTEPAVAIPDEAVDSDLLDVTLQALHTKLAERAQNAKLTEEEQTSIVTVIKTWTPNLARSALESYAQIYGRELPDDLALKLSPANQERCARAIEGFSAWRQARVIKDALTTKDEEAVLAATENLTDQQVQQLRQEFGSLDTTIIRDTPQTLPDQLKNQLNHSSSFAALVNLGYYTEAKELLDGKDFMVIGEALQELSDEKRSKFIEWLKTNRQIILKAPSQTPRK